MWLQVVKLDLGGQTERTASAGGLQECPELGLPAGFQTPPYLMSGLFRLANSILTRSGNVQLPVSVGLLGNSSSAVALSLVSSLRHEQQRWASLQLCQNQDGLFSHF